MEWGIFSSLHFQHILIREPVPMIPILSESDSAKVLPAPNNDNKDKSTRAFNFRSRRHTTALNILNKGSMSQSSATMNGLLTG